MFVIALGRHTEQSDALLGTVCGLVVTRLVRWLLVNLGAHFVPIFVSQNCHRDGLGHGWKLIRAVGTF